MNVHNKNNGDSRKSRPKLKKSIVLFVAIVSFATFTVVSIFILKERAHQKEIAEKHLQEMTDRNTLVISKVFNEYADTLRALSVYVKSVDDLKSDETLELLDSMAKAFDFDRLSIDFPDGVSYTTDGMITKAMASLYLEPIKNGEIFVTDVVKSQIDGTPRICVHVPLYKDGFPVASLSYSMSTAHMGSVLENLLADESRYFYLIDGNGNYVSASTKENALFSANDNFFDSLDTLDYKDGFSKDMIMKAFTDGVSGHTEYSLNGTYRYGYYAPIGINDWVMFTLVPKDVIDADTNKFVASAMAFTAQIAMILLGVFLVVYYEQSRMRAITELNERCFRILAEYTGKVVIEWDYEEKKMYYSNFEKTYGRKPLEIGQNFSNDLIISGEIHPDDCQIFKEMIAEFIKGSSLENVRFRLRGDTDEYLHHSLSSVVICDDKGKPHKAIGFLENIDIQVRREEYLRQKANTDQLTGCYNKSAVEALSAEILETSGSDKTYHALMCLDLDNFKGINDDFGHLYGDKVLVELSENLKSIFRKDDIVGRFGGDEFVVFINDIPNMEFVEAKAQAIVQRLHKTYCEDGKEQTVSVSVGIAISPINGNTYKTLYEKADEALYAAKNAGKNSYVFAT